MQKLSWRKASLLGIVILAASAVTAAIVPNKSEAKFAGGSMTASDPGGAVDNSCTVSDGSKNNCVVEAGTTTTAGGNESTVLGVPQTNNNTE